MRRAGEAIRGRVRWLVLVVLALGIAGSWSFAEVSVGSRQSAPCFLTIGNGDGGDSPWPFGWAVVRQHVDPSLMLNPGGDDNGDGPAAWAIDPSTGNPVVAWAYWDGSDHEIVLSRWTGTEWSAWEFLTDNALDDVDPAIAVAGDGTVRVTWWRSEDGHRTVWYRDLAAESGTPEEVTPLPRAGSRPGVALWEGDVKVAFQREEAGLRDVRVATRSTGWSEELVAQTSYAGPAGDGDIDVRVHALAGHLWVDWVDAEGQLGFSEWDPAAGAWGPVEHEPYSWGGATGEPEPVARERARARVRTRVLAD